MTNGLAGRLAANYRHIVLWASMLMLLIGTGAVYLLAVALKPIALDFGWPRSIPSLAYSLQFLGSGIGAIVMGHWLDRSGIGRPVLLGSVMIGLGAFVVSRMGSEWEFLLAYGLMIGLLGQATLFSPLMANIVGLFERRRGFAAGIVASGQAFAGVVWPLAASRLNESIGWRQTYFLYGVFVLCTMVPLSLVLLGQRRFIGREGLFLKPGEGTARPAPAVAAAPVPRAALSDRLWMIWLCVAVVGCCISMSLPLGHLVSHATDIGIAATQAAEMLAAALLAAAASRLFLLGPVSSRFGSLPGIFIFSSIQALCVGLLTVTDDVAGLYVIAIGFGLGYGGILPLYPVVVREHLPLPGIGRRTAVIILFGGIGMAAGGWIGGFLFDLTGGYATPFLVGVGANLVNLAIIGSLIARTRGTRREAVPD